MSAYKDSIIEMMGEVAKVPNSVMLGYGLTKPDKAGLAAGAAGTLIKVPMDQRIECVVAENLMLGMALGLSLMGKVPLVFLERIDFVTCCLDQIVNHLDRFSSMSNGQYQPAVIIRVVRYDPTKPLFSSETHTGNHIKALQEMIDFAVVELVDEMDVHYGYSQAIQRAVELKQSTMLVENRHLY
jgi:pyruvate/2-oxoglutarate/acetoin dehydrogenase E1 component